MSTMDVNCWHLMSTTDERNWCLNSTEFISCWHQMSTIDIYCWHLDVNNLHLLLTSRCQQQTSTVDIWSQQIMNFVDINVNNGRKLLTSKVNKYSAYALLYVVMAATRLWNTLGPGYWRHQFNAVQSWNPCQHATTEKPTEVHDRPIPTRGGENSDQSEIGHGDEWWLGNFLFWLVKVIFKYLFMTSSSFGLFM